MHLIAGLPCLVTRLHLLAEGGGFDPLKLDEHAWSLVFWTAVAFLLLLFLLTKYAWGPIGGVVRQREERIGQDLARAEEARREAEELRERHRREMEQAAQQTKALLDEARQRAEGTRADIEAKAREESEAMLERARRTIEAEKAQALREIKDQIVDLSVAVTGRLLEKAPSREDHLAEAESLMSELRR